jgi:scyllo-inosamine 4-kinase
MPIWLRVLGQVGHSRVAPRAVDMGCVGKRSHLAFERMLTGDSPHGERDHAKAQPAIREILSSLGLSSSGLRWIASYSHSAWMTDEVVVRYRTFGPTGRLSHEACVAALLPAEVPYPTVIAHGCDGENDWLVTERTPGESLYAMWPRLSVRERETATHEMAIAVRALHGSPAQHLQPPCLYGGAPVIARANFIDTLSDVVRSAADAAEPAEVHRSLELLDSCRSAIDDPPTVMAHHDLNFSQCIWRDGHVVGLVDLEMSHANSADWDLVELLGMCADPRRRANTAAAGEHVHPAQFDRVAYWFHEVYPAPFEHPALRQRLRVYELVHRLAELSQRPDARRTIVSTLELGTSYEHLLPQ